MVNKLVNRVLLINDDGIDAPGIALLKKIAEQIANEVWVVAPIVDQSGVSNSISVKAPFRVIQRAERAFAVYGTPADCVLFAIEQVMRDCPPDLVLSGINSGSNVGFETMVSGTVGGAMTATALGIPAIALSQVTHENGSPVNWDSAEKHAQSVISRLWQIKWPSHVCINVNFPACQAEAVKGMKVTVQGESDVSNFNVTAVSDPENNLYYWLRAKRSLTTKHPERELDAVNLHHIAITPIVYERTEYEVSESLAKAFSTN